MISAPQSGREGRERSLPKVCTPLASQEGGGEGARLWLWTIASSFLCCTFSTRDNQGSSLSLTTEPAFFTSLSSLLRSLSLHSQRPHISQHTSNDLSCLRVFSSLTARNTQTDNQINET